MSRSRSRNKRQRRKQKATEAARRSGLPKGVTYVQPVLCADQPICAVRVGDSWDSPDYFASEYARRGLCYLLFHCERFVLFVPPSLDFVISEMKTGKQVLASFGYYPLLGQEAWRLVFDDGTQTPFVLGIPLYLAGISEKREGIIDVRTQGGIRLSRTIIAEPQAVLSEEY